MFHEDEQDEDHRQVAQYYQYYEESIGDKFRSLTTDTLADVKNRVKRNQNKINEEENLGLIEQERGRIITDMKEHVALCGHPHCKMVEEIVLIYGFTKGKHLQDYTTYIVRKEIEGLCYFHSQCPVGSKLNEKMTETHRLIKAI